MMKTILSAIIVVLLCFNINAQELIKKHAPLKSITTVWDLDKANK